MSIDNVPKVKRNRAIPLSIRHKILEKYDHACALCGVKDKLAPLAFEHLVPFNAGGESSEDNLIVLCPSCHYAFVRQPREYEFSSFLTELLKSHHDFIDVQQEVLLGRSTRFRADILVNRESKDAKEVLLIECKSHLALASGYIFNVIEKLEKYQSICSNTKIVLAIPATLREADLSALNSAGIEVWDIKYIAKNFCEQIDSALPSYYKAFFLEWISRSEKDINREKYLINSLSSCIPGKRDCYVYQSLVGDILEHLFTPPLGKPILERPDKWRANRRDFIIPNYTDKGFWHFLREKYQADYIVIDAKNYSRKVTKSEILQIANYLKPHGAGLFGFIISRNGGDSSGCEITLREQWLVHKKMILVLDDEDVKAMLLAKSDGRNPEEILMQKIEYFRLSM